VSEPRDRIAGEALIARLEAHALETEPLGGPRRVAEAAATPRKAERAEPKGELRFHQ